MIDKYIKELIPVNSRVIIPDFGAFMIQDTPNGKVISFNDFLKFNDSVLLNKIILSEKVDANQGKESIKEYVKEIEATFKAGGQFAIEGVGYLSKDSQGNITFTQDENAKKSASNVKPSSKAETTAKKQAKEVSPKAAEPKDDSHIIKIGQHSSKADAKPVEPERKEEQKVIIPTVAPTMPKTVQSNFQSVNNRPATNNQKNKMEIKTKNKNANIIIIIVASLVIVGVLVWLAIDLKLVERFKPAQQPQEKAIVADTLPVVDTAPVVDTMPEVAEPEPVIVSEPTSDPNAKHCYIIAGSFQVESNAVRFQQQMINAGYQAEIVTRNNGFNYVSLKRFDTRVEAVAEWRNMVNENPSLWILIK